MNNKNIDDLQKNTINTESGKKIEIINEVNPYAWAQRECEALEAQTYSHLTRIIAANFIVILSIGGLLYAVPLWPVFTFGLLFGAGSFAFHWNKREKFKKECNAFESKFKNGEIKKDIEASIMSCGDYWHGKEERIFLLLDLPHRPVIDFNVVNEDGQVKLQIMMEMENVKRVNL